MISVNEALDLIKKNVAPLPPTSLPLLECSGLVLAQCIDAPIDVPPFDNAAMDGYAFKYDDYLSNEPIIIVKTIEAGNNEDAEIGPNNAVRIFTGAPIPLGADTVVQQEWCNEENGKLTFTNGEITKGINIRKKGTQTLKGSRIGQYGIQLNTGMLAFIATFGIQNLTVIPKPKVGIIVTGKETINAGEELLSGQIFESNSIALQLLLKEIGITPVIVEHCDDDFNMLKDKVAAALIQVDILITTGGISVGDYDFVKPVMDSLEVNSLFYKVKQKPGKPLYCGVKDEKIIIALPGNPAAVQTCFHVYVKYIIDILQGKPIKLNIEKAMLTNDYTKKSGLTHFLKASVDGGQISILNHQLSYQMNSFAKANALVIMEEEMEYIEKGMQVNYIPL